MTKKPSDPSLPALDMLDKLLGQVEEMSHEELSSTIAAAGIDLAAARRRLYDRVSEKRSRLWEKNAEIPLAVTSLLSQLRPHDLPSSDPNVAQKAAASWVRDLLDRRPPVDGIEFAAAARNLEGPLSDADRDIMRELEEQLRSQQDGDDVK